LQFFGVRDAVYNLLEKRLGEISFMTKYILAVLAIGLPVAAYAAETALSTAPSSTRLATMPATSWLNERGAMTTNDVVSALGVQVTAAQRAQIEQAVQARNAALLEANKAMSQALAKTLNADDEELAKRVAAERERKRMDIIRRRQPGRYNGIKK